VLKVPTLTNGAHNSLNKIGITGGGFHRGGTKTATVNLKGWESDEQRRGEKNMMRGDNTHSSLARRSKVQLQPCNGEALAAFLGGVLSPTTSHSSSIGSEKTRKGNFKRRQSQPGRQVKAQGGWPKERQIPTKAKTSKKKARRDQSIKHQGKAANVGKLTGKKHGGSHKKGFPAT